MEKTQIYRQLNTEEGVAALLAAAPQDFAEVYREADRVRREAVGDVVHLRAIIEFSNVCKRQCRYCGLNRENHRLERMRMSHGEIIAAAKEAVAVGYKTIVLQSGEDDFFTAERLGRMVQDIKSLGQVAVTLSCGERSEETYAYLRAKGADRYLLKHETADPALYARLHPCGTLEERVSALKTLRALGYETGSGFMVGLPGQTLEILAKDLLLLKEIPCQMAGIGPFISNPKTPLGGKKNGDPELTRRCVAIARLLLPEANLPVTTALSILARSEKGAGSEEADPGGLQENPFAWGANVVMKKITPDLYKKAYEIYPAQLQKTCVAGDRRQLEETITNCGRTPR